MKEIRISIYQHTCRALRHPRLTNPRPSIIALLENLQSICSFPNTLHSHHFMAHHGSQDWACSAVCPQKSAISYGIAASTRLPLFDYDKNDKDPDMVPITQLMIIYTSRQLLHDKTKIYYGGPRDLTICLGHPDYDLTQERQRGRSTNYHLSFNGSIRSRDLAYTNFSFFTSINLHMELAVAGSRPREDRFNELKRFIGEFSDLIQEWQSRGPWWSISSCPRMDVVVEIFYRGKVLGHDLTGSRRLAETTRGYRQL